MGSFICGMKLEVGKRCLMDYSLLEFHSGRLLQVWRFVWWEDESTQLEDFTRKKLEWKMPIQTSATLISGSILPFVMEQSHDFLHIWQCRHTRSWVIVGGVDYIPPNPLYFFNLNFLEV
jgi:hypothetical protein